MKKSSLPDGLVPGIEAILSENRYALSAEDKSLLIQCANTLKAIQLEETEEELTGQQLELIMLSVRLLLKFFDIDLE